VSSAHVWSAAPPSSGCCTPFWTAAANGVGSKPAAGSAPTRPRA
jgi:hypothetical protein